MNNQDSVPKRVGIWTRISTEDQARGESPEHHERRAGMYAEDRAPRENKSRTRVISEVILGGLKKLKKDGK